MKNTRTVIVLSLLAAIGIIAFFVLRVNQPISRTLRSVPSGAVFGDGSDTSFVKKEKKWRIRGKRGWKNRPPKNSKICQQRTRNKALELHLMKMNGALIFML